VAESETRRLAAIMFTDIVGFSRQMGTNEARTLRLLEAHNQVIQQSVAEHHGHVIKTVGDAFLVDFPSVVHAVQCAQHVQDRFRAYNTEKESAEQIHVRIGIHSGDIVQRDGDVFGDGVNIASRLQALAEPDTTCISHVVYQEVEKKLSLGTVVSLGRPKLKNIAQRQLVHALLPEKPEGFRQNLRVQRLKLKQWHRMLQMAAILLLIGAVALLKTFYFPAPPALSLPDKPSLVVLPFANMSEDSKQEYFSDGLSEVLTSDLSKLSELFVISRNSAFTYKGKAVKVQEVGRELGVQYVLEGSVLRAGDQVRITAQLIDATQDRHLWAERYDRPLKDIFAVQDEIVQKIVTTLKLQLSLWEQGVLVCKRTDNLEAYDYFLRGIEYCCRFTKEANAQGRQMWEKAVELDPQYAEAYAWLGLAYWQAWFFQWSPDPQNLERAFALEQKALALDDSLPTTHFQLSNLYLSKKQYDQALAEAERAIALDPNYADAYWVMGNILNFVGRPQETFGVMEKALRLNPHYPAWYSATLGTAYWLTGRTKEVIAVCKQAIARNPNYRPAHGTLAAVYSELGREAEARAEVAEMLRISPNISLEFLRQNLAFKDPAVTERFLAALRKAGLK
jgi:adenylate cyclase